MATTPAKTEARIKDALKRFQPVIEQAKACDVGEADNHAFLREFVGKSLLDMAGESLNETPMLLAKCIKH